MDGNRAVSDCDLERFRFDLARFRSKIDQKWARRGFDSRLWSFLPPHVLRRWIDSRVWSFFTSSRPNPISTPPNPISTPPNPISTCPNPISTLQIPFQHVQIPFHTCWNGIRTCWNGIWANEKIIFWVSDHSKRTLCSQTVKSWLLKWDLEVI